MATKKLAPSEAADAAPARPGWMARAAGGAAVGSASRGGKERPPGSRPGTGHGMNDERRCLIIDGSQRHGWVSAACWPIATRSRRPPTAARRSS